MAVPEVQLDEQAVPYEASQISLCFLRPMMFQIDERPIMVDCYISVWSHLPVGEHYVLVARRDSTLACVHYKTYWTLHFLQQCPIATNDQAYLLVWLPILPHDVKQCLTTDALDEILATHSRGDLIDTY